MKRILLFVLTNVAVMVVLGITASLLGVNRYLTAAVASKGEAVGDLHIVPAIDNPS